MAIEAREDDTTDMGGVTREAPDDKEAPKMERCVFMWFEQVRGNMATWLRRMRTKGSQTKF